MNIVTGASGLVGSNLVRALLAEGLPVRAVIHKDKRGIEKLPVETISADISDQISLRQAFKKGSTVFHLAGLITLDMSSWETVRKTNIVGTKNVVEACLHCGVKRLVFFSSIHAINQEPLDVPVDEDRPLADSTHFPPYDRSKAEAEKVIEAGIKKGLDAVIVRPTGIVGPYDFKPSFLGQAIIRLSKGTLPAMVGGGFDWVDARDAALGAINASLKGGTGERYLLPGHWHSVREMAEMIGGLTGKKPPAITVPSWLAYLFAPIMAVTARFSNSEPIYTRVMLRALHSNRYISGVKAFEQFGYRARPFIKTLQDTVGWFHKNGYLDNNRVTVR